jgi:hypothetical protein
LLTVVLALFAHLVWLNHHTSRTSSTLVLLFIPLYILVSIVNVRTAILTGALSDELKKTLAGRLTLAREGLWFGAIGFGFIAFILELETPEKHWKTWRAPWARGAIRLEEDEEQDTFNGSAIGKDDNEIESPVATANIYQR